MQSVTFKPLMLEAIMVNIVMLSVVMLSVVMLSVVILNVMAPFDLPVCELLTFTKQQYDLT
jgi:hypothetical protein